MCTKKKQHRTNYRRGELRLFPLSESAFHFGNIKFLGIDSEAIFIRYPCLCSGGSLKLNTIVDVIHFYGSAWLFVTIFLIDFNLG